MDPHTEKCDVLRSNSKGVNVSKKCFSWFSFPLPCVFSGRTRKENIICLIYNGIETSWHKIYRIIIKKNNVLNWDDRL